MRFHDDAGVFHRPYGGRATTQRPRRYKPRPDEQAWRAAATWLAGEGG